MLVTRRALHKPTWPGVWTNSVCGHPAPGEAAGDAVRRRVREELGLALDDLRLVLPAFRYRAVMADGDGRERDVPGVRGPHRPTAVRADPDEVDDTSGSDWAAFRAGVLDGSREVSPWCREQVQQLPEDPLSAPAQPASALPPALRGPS